MKKLLIAIVMLYVGVSSAQATLTVSGTTYDLIADRNFDVGTSVAYAEGYEAARSSYSFISTPTLRVDANGDMFLLYETNLPARLNNQINEPVIRITYRNRGQFRTEDGVTIYLDPSFNVINRRSTQDIALGLDTNPVSRNIWFDILIVDAANNIVRMNGLPITYD